MSTPRLSNRQRRAWKLLLKTWSSPAAALTRELASAYIAKYPGDGFSWVILGSVLGRMACNEEATEAFKTAERLVSGTGLSSVWIEHADLLGQLGLPKQAENLYRRARLANPDSTTASTSLALLLQRQSRNEEAKQVLIEAIRHGGRFPSSLHNGLGLVLRTEGDLEAAQEQFERALDIDSDRPLTKRALEDVRRALAFRRQSAKGNAADDPGMGDADWDALMDLPDDELPAYTLERARAFQHSLPDHVLVLIVIASALSHLEQHTQAAEALQEFESTCRFEGKHLAYLHRGHGHKRQYQMNAAMECYRHAIEAAPPHLCHHVYLGGTLARLGRFKEAKKAHRQTFGHPAGQIDEAYLNLAAIARAEEQYLKALKYADKALALDPDYTAAKELAADVTKALKIRKRTRKAAAQSPPSTKP